MVDCQWEESGTVPSKSEPFRKWGLLPSCCSATRFALASGLMEITYDTGAKVILQGPVTYEVESKTAASSRSAS